MALTHKSLCCDDRNKLNAVATLKFNTSKNMDLIFGLHAIIEAIEAGKTIDKLLLKKDLSGDLARELINLARERDIAIQRVPVEKLNRLTRKNHQGAVAMLAAVTYYKVEQVLPAVYDEGMNPFFVILDVLV